MRLPGFVLKESLEALQGALKITAKSEEEASELYSLLVVLAVPEELYEGVPPVKAGQEALHVQRNTELEAGVVVDTVIIKGRYGGRWSIVALIQFIRSDTKDCVARY